MLSVLFFSEAWAPWWAGFPAPELMQVRGLQGWQQLRGHHSKKTTVEFEKESLILHCSLERHLGFQVYQLQMGLKDFR